MTHPVLKFVFCIVFVAFAMTTAQAQDSPKALADAFFAEVMKGQTPTAFAKLIEGSPIKQQPKVIDQLRRDFDNVHAGFGKFLGPEMLREERLGGSLVRYVYLMKMEQHVTVWEFYFYKPKSSWFLAQVHFNKVFNDIEPGGRN